MIIKVNGENLESSDVLNIVQLLVVAKVESPDVVSVQLNGNFLDRKLFESTMLKDKDEVDFMYFLGGGSIE
jgi:sulfur carrier protein